MYKREKRRLMHLVPAPAVRLMKRRVLSRPGVNSLKLIHQPGDRNPLKTRHKNADNK